MDRLGYHDAVALLDWQVELGADEAVDDTPVDRFALDPAPAAAPASAGPNAARPAAPHPKAPTGTATPAPASRVEVDAVRLATDLAAAASDLPALRAAMEGFGHCPLRETAQSLVFADGLPGARVMIVGEAPGRDEDRLGKPFVGRAGQLLDRMFAAIGLDRAAERPHEGIYITNTLPWRPPQNRDPSAEELAMLTPFLHRHIALAEPEVLVLMGNYACQALLGKRGITRLRGTWTEALGHPAIPMFHPAYLLRKPPEKAKAWADLLSLKARLKGT